MILKILENFSSSGKKVTMLLFIQVDEMSPVPEVHEALQ